MDSNNYDSKVKKYLTEASEIQESYETAKSALVEEYEIKKKILTDLEEKLKNVHQADLAGEEDEKQFQIVKNDFEIIENNVNELEIRIEKINHYMESQLEGVIDKLKNIKDKYDEEFIKKTIRIKFQLMKAKYDFLITAIKARNSYLKLSEEDYQVQELFRKIGLQDVVDYREPFKDLSSAILKDGECVISKQDLYKALHSGRIPSELEGEISKAKENGLT